MARKNFYVTQDTPHPLYKTRMLTAGVPIPLDASAARLFDKLGVRLTENAPKRAAPKEPTPKAPAPVKAQAPKKAPAKRKRAAKKK